MERATHALAVLESHRVAADQQLVVLAGAAVAPAYTRPGQVVELAYDGGRAYVVLASTLEERPRLSVLLRVGRSAVLDAVAARPAGAEVVCSAPFGPGFSLEAIGGRAPWLCCAGTGIAALRPVLHGLAIERGSLAGIRLYYGARTHAHVAFGAELDGWAARGLAVFLCLSDAPPTAPRDRPGWVQDVLAAEHPDLGDAALLFAGPQQMEASLRTVTGRLGLQEGMFLVNY